MRISSDAFHLEMPVEVRHKLLSVRCGNAAVSRAELLLPDGRVAENDGPGVLRGHYNIAKLFISGGVKMKIIHHFKNNFLARLEPFYHF